MLRRTWPAWFLFFFAPVSAEYLIGYDDITGDAAALFFGLFIFGPLYGAPAVLIRELTRRAGRGWPTILLLGLAFGLIEAGLIDQSLFNTDYRAIPYWQSLRQPTLIPGIDTSASMLIGFLGGHMIGSIAAPIALTESLVPRRATKPWLGTFGLVVMMALWVAGAGIVLAGTLSDETFRPSTGQVVGTIVVVVALIVLAFTLPRRPMTANAEKAPAIPLVFAVSAACLAVRPLLDSISARNDVASSWGLVSLSYAVLIVLAVLLTRWSRRAGWGGRHVLAVAAAALLSIAVAAFTVDPLGHVSDTAKYVSNSVFFVLVAALLTLAVKRQREPA
jgi:hypothetical protein